MLLSGGQDSTTCLYWALERGPCVALSFDYGQRHRVELERAAEIARMAGAPHRVVAVDLAVPSFLTDGSTATLATLDGLPATFVPGRNLVFLAHAYAIAGALGATDIVFGANAIDYSGYPDCRPEFVSAMLRAGDAALGHARITLHAPLIAMTKREIALLGEELGARAALARSWSCYDPQRPFEPVPGQPGLFHTYDEPCGKCAACLLRAKGYEEAGVVDPAREAPPVRKTVDINKETP